MIAAWLDRWRWWWVVSAVLAVVVAPLAWFVERHWWSWTAREAAIGGIAVGVLTLALVVWTLGIAPWLSAGDESPRWRTPPRFHLNTLRLAVWTPTIVLFICFFRLDLWPLIMRWGEAGRVYFPYQYHPLMLTPIPVFVVCIAYAMVMSRRLERRMRESTRRRRVCFECGYDLRSATGGVCSECGVPAPAAV
ncbi:MAG: hypothetical protein ACF8PN_01855 [Phycisphaerales bacterium]